MAKVNKDLLEDIMQHIGVLLFKLDEMDAKIDRLMKTDDIGLAREIMHHADIKQRILTNNMNKLDEMIKEFKTLVAIVRPEVKKSGWYGEEVKIKSNVKEIAHKELEI